MPGVLDVDAENNIGRKGANPILIIVGEPQPSRISIRSLVADITTIFETTITAIRTKKEGFRIPDVYSFKIQSVTPELPQLVTRKNRPCEHKNTSNKR
jgi:hypothetical protein